MCKESDPVAAVDHRQGCSVASFQYTRVNKSIIYVTMHKWKARIDVLSCSKAPKTQQNAGYKHQKTASGLLYGTVRAFTLAPAII